MDIETPRDVSQTLQSISSQLEDLENTLHNILSDRKMIFAARCEPHGFFEQIYGAVPGGFGISPSCVRG